MRNLIKSFLFLSSFLVTPSFIFAEEGGSGHYMPGAIGTMIDSTPSQPGWAIGMQYNYYHGDSKEVHLGKTITASASATANTIVPVIVYTFEQKILGAEASLGAFIPLSHLEVSGKVGVGPFQRKVNDTADGFGDITIAPIVLNWKVENVQYEFMLPIYIPTGKYDKNDLANLGKNYWTFEPTAGINYLNPEHLIGATIYAAFDFSTKNHSTDYQSGIVFHVEGSLSKQWDLGSGYFLGLGGTAHYYQQISDDRGDGATLGGFRGRSISVGPFITATKYFTSTRLLTFEVKWFPEFDTKNRFEGDIIWAKLMYLF